MQHRGVGLTVLVGALVLSACSTTTLASTPLTAGDSNSQGDAPTIPSTTNLPGTSTTSTTSTTTIPPTTTTTTTTVPPTTTTTLPGKAVKPMTPPLDPGDVHRAQWRLVELGFWLNDKDGKYGLTTRQAVMAYQKWAGIEIDGKLGPETAKSLSAATRAPYGSSDAGTLVEVDKNKQLIFFIVDGKTKWVLNTSTGSEKAYDEEDKNTPGKRQKGDSVTRTGLFDVYRERADGWWEGDLGKIYRPKYFSGGEAIHGSNSIPGYPASHGCVRVSVPAMDWIWAENIMPMGTPVWVHGNIPGK